MQKHGIRHSLDLDCDLGHSVPGILCSHPQGLPFKRLILAAKLLQRKLKIAVHIYSTTEDMILALAGQFKQLSHEPEKFR